MNNANPWFQPFMTNITSQFGEDGIITRIFEILPASKNPFCVEFGAWDGKVFSNTYNLIQNKAFSAILIEGNVSKFQELKKNFQENAKIYPMNRFVGFDSKSGLDIILKETSCPVDFELLSIDIDGNDYHVWEAIVLYRPKVVVVEYNPTIANHVMFVQPRDMAVTQGASISSLVELAKSKSYELVATTTTNAIFVDNKYLPLFKILDNSVDTLRIDQSAVTHIFCGYDGTVFLKGSKVMPWHQLPYLESKFQMLPKSLRTYPHNYSVWQKIIAKVMRIPLPPSG